MLTDLKGSDKDGDTEKVPSVYAHKLFPSRYKYGTPVYRHQQGYGDYISSKRSVSTGAVNQPNKSPLKLVLPRLNAENVPMCNNQKQKRCPFVDNQRSYLRQRGYNLDILYSVSGARKNKKQNVDQSNEKREEIKPEFRKTAEFERKYELNSPRESLEKDLHPVVHRKTVFNPLVLRLMRGLERETRIPGHIRSEDTTSTRLGKVLSPRQMHDLLYEEVPVIPMAFYTQ